ncbi:MAG: DNA repair protein RecO [Candidatus Omnitrophota bacterium]
MAIISTPAIVLKTYDFRETSRIAVFFTRDQGKVTGILKGIRKDPKKFGSSVENFSVNDIVYYQYRNSDIHLISHCDMRSFFYPIRQDFKKTMAASYVLELVNLMMPIEAENKNIYELMTCFFEDLQGIEDVERLIRLFQIKALSFSGFRPHLDTCIACNKKVHGKAWFGLKEGGLICILCGERLHQTLHPISPGTISTILYVEKSPWKNCLRIHLTRNSRDELKYILNNFLVFHLGKKIKSAQYL